MHDQLRYHGQVVSDAEDSDSIISESDDDFEHEDDSYGKSRL